MRTSEKTGQIAAALAKAQGAMSAVAKEKTADVQTTKGYKYQYQYATLDAVVEAVRGPLSENEISYWQAAETDAQGNAVVMTRLLHSSDEWLESVITVRPANFDAQSVGSALTYCRRYSLMAACGIAPGDDDDGNAAVGMPKNAPRPVEAKAPPMPKQEAPAASDTVILTDRHGNEATYSVSEEPGSIHAAIETDMVDTVADGGLPGLQAAWKRHGPIVKRLPPENRRSLEALKDRLKAKHSEGEAVEA